jgi:hypothetical protein
MGGLLAFGSSGRNDLWTWPEASSEAAMSAAETTPPGMPLR